MNDHSAVIMPIQSKSKRGGNGKSRAKISSAARSRLKAKARAMRARQMTQGEIAAELGLSRSATAALLPKRNKARADAIEGKTLVAWVQAHSEEDAYLGLMVRGQVLSESQERAYHRWREEGVCPRLHSVEAALLSWGQTMFAEFEAWAEDHELPVWARGEAPAWWGDESDSRALEDLRSSDPEWVREARAGGLVLSEHVTVVQPSAGVAA